MEDLLRKFFARVSPPHHPKTKVKRLVLDAYAREMRREKRHFLWRILPTRAALVAAPIFGLILLFNFWPQSQTLLSAGTIATTSGPVEIVRNGETLLITDTTNLLVGDVIRIGNNAEADIIFPQLRAKALAHARVKVHQKDSLFVEQGTVHNTLLSHGEVFTPRGIISGFPGSAFELEVSESGESRVRAEKNTVLVFDWNDGEKRIEEGQTLSLRTDTKLEEGEIIPEDLKLSLAQIQAIRSKLIIARTKIVSALEKGRTEPFTALEDDFLSAKTTFVSIVHVLDATRDMQITERRDLESLTPAKIPALLAQKTQDTTLIKEARSLQTLLSLIEVNNDLAVFAGELSGVTSFDRYVLLDHVFGLGTEKQQLLGEVLKQKYVVTFLQKIQNEELRIDQVSVLNDTVELLPSSVIARRFLEDLQPLLSEHMSALLAEKIEQKFMY